MAVAIILCTFVHVNFLNQVKTRLHQEIPGFLNNKKILHVIEIACTLIETLMQELDLQLTLYDSESTHDDSSGVFLDFTHLETVLMKYSVQT